MPDSDIQAALESVDESPVRVADSNTIRQLIPPPRGYEAVMVRGRFRRLERIPVVAIALVETPEGYRTIDTFVASTSGKYVPITADPDFLVFNWPGRHSLRQLRELARKEK